MPELQTRKTKPQGKIRGTCKLNYLTFHKQTTISIKTSIRTCPINRELISSKSCEEPEPGKASGKTLGNA